MVYFQLFANELSPFLCRVKRPSFTPVKFDAGEPAKKITKTEQKIYAPPGGKFSERAGNYPGTAVV